MSIFAFCAFLPREFERNRTLSKKTIYRLRKFLGWCIIKLKIRLRIFLYTPVLCLWSSDDRNHNQQLYEGKQSADAPNPAFFPAELTTEFHTGGTSPARPHRIELQSTIHLVVPFVRLQLPTRLTIHRVRNICLFSRNTSGGIPTADSTLHHRSDR